MTTQAVTTEKPYMGLPTDVVNIHTLTAHPKNYLVHPKVQVLNVAASLLEHGQVRPIVVQKQEQGVYIVAGHCVVQAKMYLEEKYPEVIHSFIWVVYAPQDWPEDKIINYLIADNETRRGAEINMPLLGSLVSSQYALGHPLPSMGFTDKWFKDLQVQAEMAVDRGRERVAETPLINIPKRAKPGQLWQLGIHRLLVGDATKANDIKRLMGGVACDLVFVDPPYGVGIDIWDKPVKDVPMCIEHITGPIKTGGFFSFTHQMPYMLDWLNALADSPDMRFKDHIAWIKRNITAVAQELPRAHESLFTYSKGDRAANYYVTKGAFSDVKVPGLMFDTITIEGIDRYIKDLHLKLATGTNPIKIKGRQNQAYSYFSQGTNRSPENVAFTNVWSFLPEHQVQHNIARESDVHATVKPLKLMERLLLLCTPANGVVADFFVGSGTTLIASQILGRVCYAMDISPEFCDRTLARWEHLTGEVVQRIE